ncbi:hypothetical protein C9I57_02420 [Trinickia symbiotica]|uniref:Uncharacterized protein n=1 Tax=Trinickia symbiotica TaxID=863227 RepID=A0A2T3Y1L4_9BURK|nr:hypothetical protein C9I57_02420 [Trinickia symbiotica]
MPQARRIDSPRPFSRARSAGGAGNRQKYSNLLIGATARAAPAVKRQAQSANCGDAKGGKREARQVSATQRLRP